MGGGSGFQQPVCVLLLIFSVGSMILLPSAVTVEPPDERPFVLFLPEIYTSNIQGVMQDNLLGARNWKDSLGFFLFF